MTKKNKLASSTTGATSFEGTSGRSASGSASKARFSNFGSRTSQRVESSPLVALGAGAALGAVLGAVLPRTAKEKELLGPIGTKLADAGTSAVDRARDMGKQKFDEMAGDSVRQFFGAGSSSGGSGGSGSGT